MRVSSVQGKVATNAVFLYVRMLVAALSEVVAVKIVLQPLGVEGYGVFSAVTGVAFLFLTVQAMMDTTARRFLSCAMGGPGAKTAVSSAFSSALLLSSLLAVAALLLGETVGLSFVRSRIAVPAELRGVVPFVFRMGEAVIVLKLLQVPFAALIYSVERMSFFAVIGLIEAFLTVAAALVVRGEDSRGLAVFACATAAGAFCSFVAHVACGRRACSTAFCVSGLRDRLLDMGRFFLWSCLGAAGNLLKYRGFSVALSVYAGVAFNATWESGLRVGCLLCAVSTGYQQASAPMIYKSWTAGIASETGVRICRVLLRVVALALVPAVLVFVFAPGLVRLWLGTDAPPQAVAFVRCFCVNIVTDAFSFPLTTGILATGRVALYHCVTCALSAAGFLAGWIVLALGLPPWVAFAAVVASNVLACVYRWVHLRWRTGIRLCLA